MTRLIDADEFIKEMKELYKQAGWGDRDIHFSLADVISNIDMMPSAVIHCKECKYWPYHSALYADNKATIDTYVQCIHANSTDFCFMAERKKNDEI